MVLVPLPLPNAGCVRHLIHVSDLHVRTGDRTKSRYDEYKSVFLRFVKTLQSWPAEIIDSAVTVITGDIFHHKLKIESAGLDLFLSFLKDLAQLTPVYILRGNHDYRQESPDELDMLSPLLLHNTSSHRICYLDRSGHYVAGDVGFGLVTVQDVLLSGAASGQVDLLPPFPAPSFFPNSVAHKVALFHGLIEPVVPSIAAKRNAGIPLCWFEGYDVILLGDMHTQQVRQLYKPNTDNEPSGLGDATYCTCLESGLAWKIKDPQTSAVLATSQPWGYAGSMIQQNFGETLFGHGFLHWDLEAYTVSRYHVHNENGWLTLGQASTTSEQIHAMLKMPAFPTKGLQLRVADPRDPILDLLKGTHRINLHHVHYPDKLSASHPSLTLLADSASSVSHPFAWRAFVEENMADNLKQMPEPWRDWFEDAGWKGLCLPPPPDNNGVLPLHVLSKFQERNTKIQKAHSNYEMSLTDQFTEGMSKVQGGASYKIAGIEWSYLICYGADCVCRFDALPTDSIITINGRNGHGKTSFLEVICLALFGEGFPSRAVKQATLVNHKKPADHKAWSRITLHTDPDSYSIYREFSAPGHKSQLAQSHVTRLADSIVLHRGKTAVDGWVRQNVGTLDGFLLGCMMTQHEDRDFFSMKPVEQKDLLDRTFGMNAASKFVELVKEARLAHAYILDLIETLIQDVQHSQLLSEAAVVSLQDELKDTELQIDTLTASEKEYDCECAELQQRLMEARPEWLKRGRRALEEEEKQLEPFDTDLDERAFIEEMGSLKSAFVDYSNLEETHEEDDCVEVENADKKTELLADWRRYEAWRNKSKSMKIRTLADIQHAKSEAQAAHEALRRRRQDLQNPALFPTRPVWTRQMCDKVFSTMHPKYGNLTELISHITVLQQHETGILQLLPMSEVEYTTATERLAKLKSMAPNYDEVTVLDQSTISFQEMVTLAQRLMQHVKPLWDTREAATSSSQKASSTKRLMEALQHAMPPKACAVWNADDPRWLDSIQHVQMSSTRRDEVDTMTEHLAMLHQVRDDIKQCSNDLEEWRKAVEQYEQCIKFEEWHNEVCQVNVSCEDSQKQLLDLDTEEQVAMERDTMDLLGLTTRRKLDAIERIERQRAKQAKMRYQELSLQLENRRNAREVRKALGCIDAWDRMAWVRTQLDSIRENARTAQKELAVLRERWDKHCATHKKHAALTALKTVLHNKVQLLTGISHCMETGYKAWAYQHQILPMLEGRVNAVMSAFQSSNQDLLFVCSCEGSGSLSWAIKYNDVVVPLEKASGFQRFIVKLAMRMALGLLRAGDTVRLPRQLFIDEGFTACDAYNLACVPAFLKSLLTLYDQIVLVSHLEEVKEQTDAGLSILKNKNGHSIIQFDANALF